MDDIRKLSFKLIALLKTNTVTGRKHVSGQLAQFFFFKFTDNLETLTCIYAHI